MFSVKHALRAGLKIGIALLVIGMLLMSMTTNSFAARPPTPTPSPIPQGNACTSTADCLSKMTLDEKIGQMTQANKNALTTPSDITTYALGSLLSGGGEGPNGSGGTATEWANMYDNFQGYALQTRLKIPLIYGVDAVHGHNNVYGAVIFPHHIGMGATRDAALVQQADQVTRDEVLGTGIDWVFAPCVCVPRDDRWGRTYEGYGEDPTLVSSMGVASIKGFQGTGLSPTTVMATAKHYIGDGATAFGTGDSGYLIDQGNAQISETELRAIHLPPYQAAVQNGVGSVMISYSSWNGAKDHGNLYLITTVLKGELGFQGIVVSDWAGIDQLPGDYASDVRTAINAGIDMVMVPSNYKTFISTLRNEVTAGNIPMSRINDAVTRILNAKFALGLFSQPLTNRTYTAQVGSPAHRAVARQAVRESLVLLKNNGVLPLSKTGTYKLVVGGSHIDNIGNQMGGWSISWQGASGNTTVGGMTFLQAIHAAVGPSVTIQNVGTRTKGSYSGDVGIVAIGETPYAEGKGDSSTLSVSSANAAQVTDICSRVTQCVVVLFSGRPLIINTQLNQANAFVAAWLPGTEGAGITDVLFGDYGFVGKLPVTWPNAVTQEPINLDDGKTGLFPFGFGITPY
jgi:beta-glucosidase